MQQIEQQLPELEAEIDFLKIQRINTEVVLTKTKDLYTNWENMSFEDKRNIVELITEHIVIQNDTIDIALSYFPHLTISPKTAEKVNRRTALVPYIQRADIFHLHGSLKKHSATRKIIIGA
jgi:hypothetical protein